MFTTRLLARVSRARRKRIATLDLASLSDRQLSDLGITRYNLFMSPTNRQPKEIEMTMHDTTGAPPTGYRDAR